MTLLALIIEYLFVPSLDHFHFDISHLLFGLKKSGSYLRFRASRSHSDSAGAASSVDDVFSTSISTPRSTLAAAANIWLNQYKLSATKNTPVALVA